MESNTLKITLRAARTNAGMTQKDVASILHVSNKTVLNWECGISDPTFATLNELSRIYKIPLDNIILPCKST